MFTPKSVQELQFYTNILQQIINHPESLSAFQVETIPVDQVGKAMITMADNIMTEWVLRQDALERHLAGPKIVAAGPMDTAHITKAGGMAGPTGGLRLTDH